MTYAEFVLVADGHIKRSIQAHDDRMTQAWVTALLCRRKGDMLPLSDFLHSEERTPQVQTEDEMMLRMKMLTVALGGEVVEQ